MTANSTRGQRTSWNKRGRGSPRTERRSRCVECGGLYCDPRKPCAVRIDEDDPVVPDESDLQ